MTTIKPAKAQPGSNLHTARVLRALGYASAQPAPGDQVQISTSDALAIAQALGYHEGSPADSYPTPAQCAEMARLALAVYSRRTGGRENTIAEQAADLMSDLLHLIQATQRDPLIVHDRAWAAYTAESEEWVTCAGCGKQVRLRDSYSPDDQAWCAACHAELEASK